MTDPKTYIFPEVQDLTALVIELRARVEALEAANYPAKPDSSPAPAGSLVERVERAVGNEPFDSRSEARAAIRAVVVWLRENDAKHQMGGDAAATADLLDQEADRA